MKHRARYEATEAHRKGLLQEQPCEKCGADSHLHKHHEDYTKPLDVHWLCSRCHMTYHAWAKQQEKQDGLFQQWLQHGTIRPTVKRTHRPIGGLPAKNLVFYLPQEYCDILAQPDIGWPRDVIGRGMETVGYTHIDIDDEWAANAKNNPMKLLRVLRSVAADGNVLSEETMQLVAETVDAIRPKTELKIHRLAGVATVARPTRLQPQLLGKIDAMCKRYNCTRSEMVCTALDYYVIDRDEYLKQYGA